MISVIVVEDDPTSLFMLETILTEHGHKCTAVSDVQSARKQMAENHFDIVLTDIKMPGENGLDLIRHVNQKYPKMACVPVTSLDDPQKAEEIIELGVHGYIVKPFTANIVEIAIQNALRMHALEQKEKDLNKNLMREVERKTKSLNNQLAFLQSLIDSIPIPVYYKDVDCYYIGCNKEFEKILGLNRNAIIGFKAKDIYEKKLAEVFAESDAEVLSTEKPSYFECEVASVHGKVHSTIIKKDIYRDGSGCTAGIIGAWLDITKLKKADKLLRASEGKIRSIIDNLPVGVVLFDLDMKVLTANMLMKNWFSVDDDTLNNLNEQLVALHVRSQLHSDKGENECVETLATPEGEKIFRTILTHVKDEENAVISTVKIFEDITQHLEIERELRQAQKLESIGQLAAGIAHEINTPIQYIGDNLNFLSDVFNDIVTLLQKYGEMYKEAKGKTECFQSLSYLKQVIDEVDPEYLIEEIPITISQSLAGVKRVSNIVCAMRDFSHPGSEEKTALDINKALCDTILVSKNEWKYVADIKTQLTPDLPAPLCHSGEIHQVFLNIIINAAHAIEDFQKKNNCCGEKGEIAISTTSEGERVVIKISDTGIGISEKIKNRIYDPFFTTKEVGRGTGQGLAIAHNVIVEKHNGQLQFDSMPGRGTTFSIKLPLDADVM